MRDGKRGGGDDEQIGMHRNMRATGGGHANKTRSTRMMALAAVPIMLRLVACTFLVITMTVTAGVQSQGEVEIGSLTTKAAECTIGGNVQFSMSIPQGECI